jgi:hypothetical protein
MRERRRRAAADRGPTALALEEEGPRLGLREGIPVLLLPERVMLLVDASLLIGPLAVNDEEDGAGGSLQRLGRGLARSWVDRWDY